MLLAVIVDDQVDVGEGDWCGQTPGRRPRNRIRSRKEKKKNCIGHLGRGASGKLARESKPRGKAKRDKDLKG